MNMERLFCLILEKFTKNGRLYKSFLADPMQSYKKYWDYETTVIPGSFDFSRFINNAVCRCRIFQSEKVWPNFVGDTEFDQVADDSANFYAISAGLKFPKSKMLSYYRTAKVKILEIATSEPTSTICRQ